MGVLSECDLSGRKISYCLSKVEGDGGTEKHLSQDAGSLKY